nr:conjugal transfer protein MobA [Bacteroides ovatus]
MEETMLHRTTARRERRAAIRRRRILCSNEHSKLCFRPTGSVLSDENRLPDLTVGEFPPKSEIRREKRTDHNYAKSMKEESRAKTGRKPKSDPADYKYSFRLNAGENMRFEKLVTESEAKDKTRFIKKAIFGGTIKVVKIDKATMDYYIRLTEFHKQFQAVGNNYNQVVRAIRSNFGEKRAMSLLYKLEKMTLELMLLNKKVIALTEEYQKKWLQK